MTVRRTIIFLILLATAIPVALHVQTAPDLRADREKGVLVADGIAPSQDHTGHEGHGDHRAHEAAMAAPPRGTDEPASAIEPLTSNFATGDWLQPANVPGSSMEPVGAFRFVCNVAKYGYVDPLVYPGVNDKRRVHLHMFFGNDAVTERSTYASLRANGTSTCQGGPNNRSGYWMPAMLNGRGQAVNPAHITVYYKRRPTDDPVCRTEGKACVDLPRGLKAVFGNNYVIGEGQNPHARFDCGGRQESISASLTAAARMCRPGETLYARIYAPYCWDGRRTDSPDHQAHMAYPSYTQPRGELKCPPSHPYIMPEVIFVTGYPIRPGDDPTQWAFSSDVMMGRPAGSTFHADYMEAWDPEIASLWHANCLNRRLSCNDGNLGNGRILKPHRGFTHDQQPHLVPIPD